LKIEKSPYLVLGLSYFNEISHGDAVRLSSAVQPLKVSHLKIQDGGSCHLEKSKNGHISAAIPPISTKFGTVTQFEGLDRADRYISKNLKIQDGGGRHLYKSKNHHLGRGLSDFNEISQGDVVWSFKAARPLKVSNFKNPRWRQAPS